MSMRSSFVYGYGFEIYKTSDEELIEFIKNHKDTFCKSDEEKELYNRILNYREEDYNYGLEELFEDEMYACDYSGQEGFGAPISNIISRETNIRFQYEMGCSDCCSNPSVLFSETYPWNCNETEKNLTIESLTETLLPYVEELGLSKDDIGYVEVEYYG